MKTTRIVLVDDDTLQLNHYERILGVEGYEVKKFINAHDAIDGIDDATSVIVADLLLGYNTVFPLLNELQSQASLCTIPIVICSNLGDTLPVGALNDYGVRKILDKTNMHPSDLVAAIRSIVQ